MINNAKLLSDQFRGLQSAIASMPDEVPIKALCQSFLDAAKGTLSELQNAHLQAYELVERLALELASLATCVNSFYATEIHDQKEKAGESRRIANTVSEMYADVARAKAAQIWATDTDEEFRVGEMAELVHGIMVREGYFESNSKGKVTTKVGTLRKWIAPFAPEYGRRPGKSTKTEE